MMAGHLAAALAAKKATRRAPLWVLVAAAYGLDLLWPVLLLLGLESVRIEPGNTAFTPLAFESYPWSHSLAMAALWSLAAAAAFLARSRRVGDAAVVGLVVLSHWVLDFVTHAPDLPLWPDGPEVGLGLWDHVAGTYFLEGILLGSGVWLYMSVTRPRDRVGTLAITSLVVFVILVWAPGPFAPPPPGATAVAVVTLGLFLLPLWARWAERHRLVLVDSEP